MPSKKSKEELPNVPAIVQEIASLLAQKREAMAQQLAVEAFADLSRLASDDVLATFLAGAGTVALYADSIPLAHECLTKALEYSRRTACSSPNADDLLRNVAALHLILGEYSEAEQLCEETLNSFLHGRTLRAPSDLLVALTYLNEAQAQGDKGRIARHSRRNRKKYVRLSDAECQRACEDLLSRTIQLLEKEDFNAMYGGATSYLRIAEQYPRWAPGWPSAANLLARACFAIGRFKKGLWYAKQSLAKASEVERPYAAQFAHEALVSVGERLMSDEPESAVDSLRDALTLVPDETTTEHLLTRALTAAGRTDEAAALLERLLPRIRDDVFAVASMDFATIDLTRGYPERAEQRLRSLIPDLRARASPELVTALLNLSVAVEHRGNQGQAEEILLDAYSLITNPTNDAWRYQVVHEKVVAILVAGQRYAEALGWQERLFNFVAAGDDDDRYRSVRSDLGALFAATGDHERAFETYRATLQEYRIAGDVTSGAYLKCLTRSARSAVQMGQPVEAWAKFYLAEAIVARAGHEAILAEIGDDLARLARAPERLGADVATSFNMHGEYLAHLTQHAKMLIAGGERGYGIPLLREVAAHCRHDAVHRRVYISSQLALAEALEQEGTAATTGGQPGRVFFQEAAEQVDKALNDLQEFGGGPRLDGYPSTGPDRYTEKALVLRGRIATALGRHDESFALHQDARRMRKQWLTNNSYYQGIATDDILAAAAVGRWEECNDSLRTWMEEDNRSLGAVLSSPHESEDRLIAYVRGFRSVYVNAISVAAEPTAPPSTRRLVMDLILRRKSIVFDAARALATGLATNLNTVVSGISITDVAAALPEGAALVEYVRSVPVHARAQMGQGESRWGAPRYFALIMTAGTNDPVVDVVDLGDANALETSFAEWLRHLTGDNSVDAADGSFQATWLAKALSPDEPFGLASSSYSGAILRKAMFDPIAARTSATRFILSPDGIVHMIPFHALPGESDFLLSETPRIEYVTSGRDLLRGLTDFGTSAAVVIGDPEYGDGTHGVNRFERLINTREEVETIGGVLGVKPICGTDATLSFLRSVISPCVLHIATHGFADESIEDSDSPLHMLRHCGLALAGANTGSKDGVLTAEDATRLPLVGTTLVVLSACETGRGLIVPAEGVVGFRRAFMIAGARALVVSLWPIPDAETSHLMIKFYEHLLDGATVGEALRLAQMTIRQQHEHPYYWGAFICIGDAEAKLNA